MVCNVVKNEKGVAFVCKRGNSKLSKKDQQKIDEIIKNLEKKLEENKKEQEQ